MFDLSTLQTFLTGEARGPYVSLYLPYDGQQDVAAVHLALRHLIEHAEAVMAETAPEQDWAPYASQLATLFDTPQRTLAGGVGLGVLCDAAHLQVFELETPVQPAAMVTALPQLLPLLADLQAHHDFDVLVLQRDQIAFYQHRQNTLQPVTLPDSAPQTLLATLGEEKRGGGLNSISQGQGNVSYHGHGDKAQEDAGDTKRFFQQVDAYLSEHYSKPTRRPLALFGLPQNIAVFRDVSRNPHLSSVQLALSPSDLSPAVLARVASTLRADFDAEARHALSASLDAARSGKRVVSGAKAVATAVAAHAVVHLLLQNGARISGRLADGQVVLAGPQAHHNNLLNDLAVATVMQGGRVSLLPEAELDAPAVGLTRYAL